MQDIRGKVAVVGVGYSKISRDPHQSLGLDTVEACAAAVADAGLLTADIDGVSTAALQPFSNAGVQDGRDFVTPAYLVPELGLTDVSWTNDDPGKIGSSFLAAIDAVAAGECKYALVWRALSFPRGERYSGVDPGKAAGSLQFFVPYGYTDAGPPAYSHIYRRYMERYGATREHMASFVVNNRTNALINERGYWRNYRPEPLSREEYLNGRMIADPFCIHDCDLPVQGCAAYVLTSSERANAGPHNPAYIVSCGDGGDPASLYVGQGPLEAFQEFVSRVGKSLWESSGLGPRDVATANLYDGFSFVVYLYLEGLGFCKEGEGPEFVQGGRVSLKGELPLNTSGGNLGEGRLHGAAHITEAVLQAMGRAGPRQVKDAAITLAAVGIRSWGQAVLFSRDPP